MGEIIGGSQREERLEMLDARMEERGIDKEHYGWYRTCGAMKRCHTQASAWASSERWPTSLACPMCVIRSRFPERLATLDIEPSKTNHLFGLNRLGSSLPRWEASLRDAAA